MVVGILAFVLLMGIGYYNGRQNHPEIFDTEAIVTTDPHASVHPLSYPQIDLTEETSEEASHGSGTSASPAAAAEVSPAADKAAGKKGSAPAAEKAADKTGAAAKTEKPAGRSGAAPAAKKAADKTGAAAKTEKPTEKTGTEPAAKKESAEKSAENDKSAESSPAENEDTGEISDLVYDTSWPPPQNRPRTESTFWQRIPSMLMFLVLVCALIWISLRIIAPFSEKLTGNPAPKKQINVIERKSLGPNKAVVLIEVADKRLVLGITEKTITTLAELESPPPPADSEKPAEDKPGEEDKKKAPPRDLVKEVIAKHLSSLPSLK